MLRRICRFPLDVRATTGTNKSQERGIFWLLYSILNKPDRERIKTVGPDIACAEWLVRCGAYPKFKNQSKFVTEWNQIPSSVNVSKLVEVLAEDTRIMPIGMVHFDCCKHLRKLTVKQSAMFNDSCLTSVVQYLSGSLTYLDIEKCDISEESLHKLRDMQVLQQLKLKDLLSVKSHDGAFKLVKSALPKCEITYTDSSSGTILQS